jgi:undecaprenyl-diphosphatase
MISIDTAIFRSIYGIGASSGPMRALSIFFATYLIFLALSAAVVALVRVRRDQASRLVLVAAYLRAAAAAALGYAGNALFALVFFRPRPFVTLGVTSLIGTPGTSKSFPSDHATLAFAIAGTLAFAWPQRRWQFLVVAALIAVGRVMAGVHYPTDVLAGALVGLCWAWAVETVDVRGGGAASLRIARVLTRHRV